MRRAGVHTIGRLCAQLNFADYASRVVHPLARMLDQVWLCVGGNAKHGGREVSQKKYLEYRESMGLGVQRRRDIDANMWRVSASVGAHAGSGTQCIVG